MSKLTPSVPQLNPRLFAVRLATEKSSRTRTAVSWNNGEHDKATKDYGEGQIENSFRKSPGEIKKHLDLKRTLQREEPDRA